MLTNTYVVVIFWTTYPPVLVNVVCEQPPKGYATLLSKTRCLKLGVMYSVSLNTRPLFTSWTMSGRIKYYRRVPYFGPVFHSAWHNPLLVINWPDQTTNPVAKKARGVRQNCYKKKAATVVQNGRLATLCNFFSFWLIKLWGTSY